MIVLTIHNLIIRKLVAIAIAMAADNICVFPRLIARSSSQGQKARSGSRQSSAKSGVAHNLQNANVHMRRERASPLDLATIGAELRVPCLAVGSLD